MQLKNVKVRCIKQSLPKFDEVVKTYSPLQTKAAEVLSADSNYVSIRCNVDCVTVDGIAYTSDFLCTRENGEYAVFECVYCKYLTKPKTVKLLDESQKFWLGRGVAWGLIVEADAERQGAYGTVL